MQIFLLVIILILIGIVMHQGKEIRELERRLAHGGNPVLGWMMDNIYVRTNPTGNIKADKEKSTL